VKASEGKKMGRKRLGAALALVMLLVLQGVSHALTQEQKVLVGLKGVEVVIEQMQPEAESLGLTKEQLQTDVELRLRKAGIKVLTKREALFMPGMPWLYVNVNTLVRSGFPLLAYSVRVILNENVTLANGFQTVGTIWSSETTGNVGTQRISQIRESVGDLVDGFINDYLAANPK
jgi:hypothetical protein